MKLLERHQLEVLFCGQWKKHRGDLGAILELIQEHGFTVGRGSTEPRAAKSGTSRARTFVAANSARVRALTAWAVEAVAELRGMTVAEIAESRARGAVRAAQEVAWVCKQWRPALSTTELAIAMSRGDHTTAMAALERVEQRIAERSELRRELLALLPARPALKAVA